MAAMPSAAAMLIHTPLVPHISGKMMRNGTRNTSCRLTLRKMLFFAMPMDWKKLPVTIWNPTIGLMQTMRRMPLMVKSVSCASSVKSMTGYSGKNSQSTNEQHMMIVASAMARLRTSLTRSKFCAPKLNPAIGCMPWHTPSTTITKRNVMELTMP